MRDYVPIIDKILSGILPKPATRPVTIIKDDGSIQIVWVNN